MLEVRGFQEGLIGQLHQDLRFQSRGGSPIRASFSPAPLLMPRGGAFLLPGSRRELDLLGYRFGPPGIYKAATDQPRGGGRWELGLGALLLALGAVWAITQIGQGGGGGTGGGSGGSGTDDQTRTYYTYGGWQARVLDNQRYFDLDAAGNPRSPSPPPSPPARNKGNYYNLQWVKEQLRLRNLAQQHAQRLGVSLQRFEELSYDPDNSGLTQNSLDNEATAAVRAERDGVFRLRPGDLQRGTDTD
jgi:hypothetical protein